MRVRDEPRAPAVNLSRSLPRPVAHFSAVFGLVPVRLLNPRSPRSDHRAGAGPMLLRYEGGRNG